MKTNFYFAILIAVFMGVVSLKTYADSWVQKANFGGTAREGATGFAIGTKGYFGTGYDITNNDNDFWEYDPVSNTWTQKANFGGTARFLATGFAIGTKGYIGTGTNGSPVYNDFWEYDQGSNTWMQKANFGGVIRAAAAGFAIGTKGYIGTGWNSSSGVRNDFWEYDQGSNTWTQKANFGGSARESATGFSIGSKGYIGTGYYYDSTSHYLSDFWEYDQPGNTWTQKANFSGSARYNATGFAIGTKGYIGTGYDGSDRNDFWEYDQGSNTWTQKTNFGGTARYSATCFVIGTNGYIGTGYSYQFGTFYNDFWEYTPDSVNGVEELNINNAFNIYPNPLTSSSILQLNTQLKNAEAVIYDMVGKEMMRKKITGDRMEIEKGSLVCGVYFVRVQAEEKEWVQKIVVE